MYVVQCKETEWCTVLWRADWKINAHIDDNVELWVTAKTCTFHIIYFPTVHASIKTWLNKISTKKKTSDNASGYVSSNRSINIIIKPEMIRCRLCWTSLYCESVTCKIFYMIELIAMCIAVRINSNHTCYTMLKQI